MNWITPRSFPDLWPYYLTSRWYHVRPILKVIYFTSNTQKIALSKFSVLSFQLYHVSEKKNCKFKGSKLRRSSWIRAGEIIWHDTEGCEIHIWRRPKRWWELILKTTTKQTKKHNYLQSDRALYYSMFHCWSLNCWLNKK